MKFCPTYEATIYAGLKNLATGYEYSPLDVERLCADFCNAVGLCVSVTPTTFVYNGGQEPGVIVGLINYPRFPSTPERIQGIAYDLAAMLKHELSQLRLSIVFPGETVMLEEHE